MIPDLTQVQELIRRARRLQYPYPNDGGGIVPRQFVDPEFYSQVPSQVGEPAQPEFPQSYTPYGLSGVANWTPEYGVYGPPTPASTPVQPGTQPNPQFWGAAEVDARRMEEGRPNRSLGPWNTGEYLRPESQNVERFQALQPYTGAAQFAGPQAYGDPAAQYRTQLGQRAARLQPSVGAQAPQQAWKQVGWQPRGAGWSAAPQGW